MFESISIKEISKNPTLKQAFRTQMFEERLEKFSDEDTFIEKLWEIRKSPVQSEQMGLYPIEQEEGP